MGDTPGGDGAEERMRSQDEAIGNMMREINRLQQMLANQQAVMAAAGVIDAQGNPVQGGGQAGLAQVLNALLERMGGGLGDGPAMPLHANSGIGALSSFKTDSVKIMKFGGKNYHLWRWNAERQMELMGCWKLIKGEKLMPDVATDKQIQENGGIFPDGCAKTGWHPLCGGGCDSFQKEDSYGRNLFRICSGVYLSPRSDWVWKCKRNV